LQKTSYDQHIFQGAIWIKKGAKKLKTSKKSAGTVPVILRIFINECGGIKTASKPR
jgi:hypothetical protein